MFYGSDHRSNSSMKLSDSHKAAAHDLVHSHDAIQGVQIAEYLIRIRCIQEVFTGNKLM